MIYLFFKLFFTQFDLFILKALDRIGIYLTAGTSLV